MKNIIFKILKFINKIFYPSFDCPKDLLIATFKNVFIQKIIGVNRKVAWPVHFTSKVISPKKINIGTRAPGLAISCYLDGRNGINIGHNVWIGPGVTIVSRNHSITNYNDYELGRPIAIGNDCWIAANVTILPGVSLGNHVVVAAGSVVTKSFTEGDVIIAGVPAKKIKDIPSYEHVYDNKSRINE